MIPRKTRRGRLPVSAQIARERALEALNLMRSASRSLRRAAAEAHTTPRTVLKYAGTAVRRATTGRYQPMRADRLSRRLQFLTPLGKIAVTVRGSRTASKIANYWAAVDKYLKTGDAEPLRAFAGKSVRVGKITHPFLTDRRALERLGNAGEVSFEDLYVRAT